MQRSVRPGAASSTAPARRRRPAAAAVLVLALAFAQGGVSAPRPAALPDRHWPGFGGTSDEQHFSPLAQVNAANVRSLGLVWSLDLPPGNASSGPVEAGGVLYTATGYSVVRAMDAATGRLLWTYDPKAPEAAGQKLRQGWGIRGLAYDSGRVFVGTHDGRLISLDARTGKLVWSTLTVPKDDMRFISGPPRVFHGLVIIGHGGADVDSIRGYVTAYDAATGKQAWRFYTVPGNPADGFEDPAQSMAAKTWSGDWWKYGGGGTVWNAMTYDASTDTIILGTGNGAPWNHRVRSAGQGDNLFLASIVGLDARTGAYKWHYQVNPAESWDYNASMDIELADLTIDGRVRHVLMTAPKNGFLYVIDRTDGKLISAKPYVKVTWASGIDTGTGRPVEAPDIRYPDGKTVTMWPGPVGAHTWLPMAFSPQQRLVYIPAIEMGTSYNDVGIRRETWTRAPGGVVDAASTRNYFPSDAGPTQATSALVAWDPVAQQERWRISTPGLWNGGVLATAGDLVFQGRVDGTFNAYSAVDGRRLWSFAAQAPVTSPPISYSVGGRQYVTVLTGLGTSGAAFGPMLPTAVDYRTQARRVLTFALGGTKALPVATPFVLRPPEDPGFQADAESAERGRGLYGRYCTVCHGQRLVAAGNAPDLRGSMLPQSGPAFAAVVRDGLLVPKGMPRFEELTDAQLDDIRQYVRAEARKVATGAPAKPAPGPAANGPR